jgi:SAM-dependent methyltransferase
MLQPSALLPARLRPSVRYLYRHAGFAHFCPLCERRLRRFLTYGNPVRPEARCPVCQSLERHRLLWLYLSRETSLLTGEAMRLLHIAPEQGLAERLRRVPSIEYLSVDIDPKRAMQQADITALPFPDESFDVVLCSHVLEHVADDRTAMTEIRRIVAPNGWAVIQCPIYGVISYENWEYTRTPEDRLQYFGQDDHVRIYGRDIADRLHAVGFHVDEVLYPQHLGAKAIVRYGLEWSDRLYLCK